MDMNLRDIRQAQFADMWVERGCYGILHLAARFGKIFTSINIMEKIKPETVLIAYPDGKIRKAWESDILKRDYKGSNITYTTYLSLHKHVDKKFSLIILDEIHTLSEAQREVCRTLIEANERILGLSGTLSKGTQKVLLEYLSLPVVAYYPIELAIKEGILPDYEINVIKVPLDKNVVNNYKGKMRTEHQRFEDYEWVIKRLEDEGKPSFFMKLKLIEILQNSRAKKIRTQKLIEQFYDERLLVFCGRTDVADSLGIPSFHSKTTDKKVWEDFMEGREKHMAVCKIGNTGTTYTPLNKVIINYFDSNEENLTQKINRAMSLEYDNPEKKAIIYIISSDKERELKWLKNALKMFSSEKIKYL